VVRTALTSAALANNRLQRTALRAAADAERWTEPRRMELSR
jgi:hypothetical protein